MNEQQNSVMTLDNIADSFTLEPFEKDIHSETGLVKLQTTKEQKAQLSALTQHIPAMMAATTMADCYLVRFPDGLQHSLTQLKQGGVMSMYQDEAGNFAGTASMYKTSAQAAILGTITIMSAVSGQYYLSKINNNLSVIKMGIDKILEFLYGDKKAELMSEVSFVKYAYENYESMVNHESQRIATITSLQQAKKVAMKDIEFYMNDLDSTVRGKDTIDTITNKALQIKESLDLSIQLYGMSTVLEVYYSGNHESEYLDYVDRDVSSYIDKCEKRILSSFSVLSRFVGDYKGKMIKKVDKSFYEKSVQSIIESLNTGRESELRKTFREAIRRPVGNEEYYLTKDGDIYLRVS